jgi:hypothetical protein
MKPQTLIGLAVVALYTLSGCSQQNTQTSQYPAAVSNHSLYNKTLAVKQVNPQRQIAPRGQVSPQQQITTKAQVSNRQHVLPVRPQVQMRQHTSQGMPNLSSGEVRKIGDQIFKNESGGDINKLVHWNKGENFASMGIGHFTWYPAGRKQRFGNTFPGMLTYLESRGIHLPLWVKHAKYSGAPWRTRSQLMREKNNPQVQVLQRMLYETRYLQTEYIMLRAQRAMPKLVTTAPTHLRPLVANNLNAVANSHGGWYPLIDYVNFKGEGLSRAGGYRNRNGSGKQNWGLLQVLEEMRPVSPGQGALNEFADAAMRVLNRRVRNSDPKRNEKRWLAGWNNRISTYRHAS